MPGFAAGARSRQSELMDTETVPFEDFRACLADLSTVNRLSLGYRPTLAFLTRLHRAGASPAGRPLSILDVGSGYGDALRAIDDWAAARGLAVTLTGVDLNPWSTRSAEEASRGRSIRWVTADAFDYARTAAEPVDVIVSSLFCHHLGDDDFVRFLGWCEATARVGWFVNDLHRHAVSYHGFRLISGLAGWHRFVRHDGPVSIARGFVRADFERALASARVPDGAARIEWWAPFRLCIARPRAPEAAGQPGPPA